MTNIIILICTILVGFFVGKYLERRQVSRWHFFVDLQKYIVLLRTNIKSKCIELQTFDAQFAQSCSGVFAEFLQTHNQLPYLTKGQNQLVASFVHSLSATTSTELLNNLLFFEQQIELEFAEISNDYRNRHACVKLTILCGVMVGILLM